MTIRYARDGLKIVRVVEDAPRLSPEALSRLTGTVEADDYHLKLHRFATEVRAAVRRYRQPTYGVTPALVREARRRSGLGQRQLGLVLGIARSSIAEAEIGRRPIHKALAAWVRETLGEEGQP